MYSIYDVGRVGSPTNLLIHHDNGNTFTDTCIGITWNLAYQSKRLSETNQKCFFSERKTGYATIQSYSLDSFVLQQHFIKTNNGGKNWQEGEL